MANGYESSVRMTLTALPTEDTEDRREIIWSVRLRDGPLKLDPEGFNREITLTVTQVGTGEKMAVEIDGNASTWDTFRLLATSGIPALADLFGGHRASMID